MITPSMTIDGGPVATRETFTVINPATEQPVAEAPSCSRDQVDVAVVAAHSAFASWSRSEDARRSALREGAEVLESSSDRLAAILTAEQGKTLPEAAREVRTLATWLRYYADLETPISETPLDGSGRATIQRRPYGVVAGITPWNYPLSLAGFKIAPALRAGNTVVLKPSPFTPLATLAMVEILQSALPPGVLNVVTGPDPLGNWLTAHPLVRKISFTGSTRVGKLVAAAAADDLKRVTLELGGNDPAIVLPDADPSAVAESMFWRAFTNNGQICVAVKRLYVHERIHGELVEALSDIASRIRVGDGALPDSQLGPVNNMPQLEHVDGLVQDAVARGAVALSGGHRLDRPGYFFPPTILTSVPRDAAIVREEQFGPALPVLSYGDVDDVVREANDSPYGLSASVWSPDVERAVDVAQRLEAGQISINSHAGGLRPYLPFAGHKWSGVGVENGPWGLDEYTQPQVIAIPPGT